MTIHVLAPEVAAKIAAGEVVERPASVVKELLENSLDAGATEIRVELREGGQRLLRVTDNGHGIAPNEAAMAFQRHATSKIVSSDDLTQIQTFGFRGEALYSIAAVSQVTLTSRDETSQGALQLRLHAGEIVQQTKIGAPVGTVISVENLFYNVPARKKFLRRPATETGRISSIVQRYALAHPERRFSLVVDGRLAFQSTGTGDLFDVLVKVYGLENARQMRPLGASQPYAAPAWDDIGQEIAFMEKPSAALVTDSSATEPEGAHALSDATVSAGGPIVYGYASLPSLTRANRGHIELFVNRRYIEDRNLTYAVVQAYHTLLPGGRFPIAVVMINIPADQVDVNVHPQKTEVRFVEDRRVFSAVQKTVRQTIIAEAPVPDMQLPRSDVDTPAPSTPSWFDREEWSARRNIVRRAGQPDYSSPSPVSEQAPATQPGTYVSSQEQTDPSRLQDSDAQATSADHPARGAQADKSVAEASGKLPPLRVVGQVGTMYIVAEGPQGVYLIDQHAAHERILYEKFMEQRRLGEQSGIPQQQLLEPLTLHVGHDVTGLVDQYIDQLAVLGFDVTPFGGDTFLVRAVPAILAGQDPMRTVEEIVSALSGQRNLVQEEMEARLVKMICKRAAIKAGQQLSTIEMQELVRQLEQCQSPRTCPHGRPTMLQLSAGELEKAFGRT